MDFVKNQLLIPHGKIMNPFPTTTLRKAFFKMPVRHYKYWIGHIFEMGPGIP